MIISMISITNINGCAMFFIHSNLYLSFMERGLRREKNEALFTTGLITITGVKNYYNIFKSLSVSDIWNIVNFILLQAVYIISKTY